MHFSQFALYLQELESTSSRLEMTAQLAKVYLELDSNEVAIASYLLQGQLLPAYESLEFQLSVKMVIRALARIYQDELPGGVSLDLFGTTDISTAEDEILKRYKASGDLGQVAEQVMTQLTTQQNALSVHYVYQALTAIAMETGNGSQERKLEKLVALLRECSPISAKFVVRIVLGKLRLGFSTMTMIDALSWAKTGSKDESKQLEAAYQRRADIGKLAQVYLLSANPEQRLAALTEDRVEVGVPVVPALCQRLNSAQEIIEKMGEVYVEPKYDGLRVQIHIQKTEAGAEIKAFTRNLENVTHMFPELEKGIELLQCDSCILDAEAIGYDRETGELLPFQETITRKRKHEIEATAENIPVRFYVFDVLSLNGSSLIEEKLRERKSVLKDLFIANEVFYETPYIVTNEPEKVRSYHEQQLSTGLEGAVIKQTDSEYQSGRKGWTWVKIKEEEGTRGKLRDTLDCVVMGLYAGRGKRTQFGLGAFLVGVLSENDEIRTIAKIGTGLSDEQFRELKRKAEHLIVQSPPSMYQVPKQLEPDVWLQPELVAEIAADEITRSPLHTAGVALRFPRLVRFREDKKWQDSTTTEEVTQLSQSV